MDEAARCKPTEHDYHPLPRMAIRETVRGNLVNGDHQTVEHEHEPARLYCQKCGWVRDLPAL